MAKTYDYSKLSAEERWILDQTLKTGNLNYFTNFYFRLPNSGTMWMPDDSLGNYRNVFQYQQLHDAGANNGKPETFTISADGNVFNFRLIWAPGQTDPTFLFPHGYIMLDWMLPVVDLNTQVALAITGTGTGKCLPAEAVIDLCDGQRKKIVELVIGVKVWGLDSNYRLAKQTVVGIQEISHHEKEQLKIPGK